MGDEEAIEVKHMVLKPDLAVKLTDILDEVEQNPDLRLLMKEISNPDSPLSRFLLTDSYLVFIAENLTEPAPNGATAIRLPVLFWTSVALDAQPIESLQRLLLLIERKKEDTETSKLQLFKMFSQVLDVRDFRDLLAYFSLKFARSSPKTKDLVRRRKFSFREMQKTLGNYDDIDPNRLFSEISDTSKSSLQAETDKDVVQLMTNVPKRLFGSMISNIEGTILSDFSQVPSVLLDVLSSRPFPYVKDLEASAQLKPEEYQKCVNFLYDLKLLQNMESIFWCSNREHEPLMMETKASLGALNAGPPCPKCQQATHYNVVYQPTSVLKDSILFSGGGMLTVLVGWFLRQRRVKFEHSVKIEGNEIDFLVEFPTDKWLVECKMHRRNMAPEAFVQACQRDIKKLEKKLDILKKQAIEPRKNLLVSNWSDDMIKDVTKIPTFANKIQKAGIQIVGYNVFPDILHSA